MNGVFFYKMLSFSFFLFLWFLLGILQRLKIVHIFMFCGISSQIFINVFRNILHRSRKLLLQQITRRQQVPQRSLTITHRPLPLRTRHIHIHIQIQKRRLRRRFHQPLLPLVALLGTIQ